MARGGICPRGAILALALGTLCCALAHPGAVGASGPGEQTHGSWMSRHKQVLSGLAVNQVTLLGSHDAASRDIFAGSPPAKGYLTRKGKHLKRRASEKDVLSARCQSATIAEQLTSGVRYLDLRVAHQDGEYFALHMWLSTPFFGSGSVTAQIKGFLTSHPDEVLIIYLQHLYSGSGEMDDAEATALIARIARDFPGLLIEKNDFSRLTFAEIWRGTGRIILVCGRATDLAVVWDAEGIDSTWFDQKAPETLIGQLDGVVASWRGGQSRGKLRHLQAMTTTGEKVLAAQTTNALVKTRLEGDWRGAPISVVQVDDAANSGLMSVLIDRLK